jgi:flagellar biosynthesis protein FliR
MSLAALTLMPMIFARTAGLTLTAPIFGGAAVPTPIRVLFALMLTLLIAPLQSGAAVVTFRGWMDYTILLGGEALIGACLGLGVLVFMHGMTLAGELISQAGGLGMAEVFDPTLDESTPLFSRLLFLATVAFFFLLGGHRVVMAGLLDAFRALPPGHGLPGSLAQGFVALMGQSFWLGVRAAAPAVTALLAATLTLGLIGRTLPQLNILAIGLGLNAMLALALFALTFGVMLWVFQDQVQTAFETIFNALKTPLQTQWMN